MKKQSKFSVIASAMSMAALSLLPSFKSPVPPMLNQTTKIAANSKDKNTPVQTAPKQNIKVENLGGLPLFTYQPNYGMSPKEYGMRFGNGGSKKSNRLRLGHNAKLKRRGVC